MDIFDKNGRLDDDELRVVRSHHFETQQKLRNIKGFEDIGSQAAQHHEEPGGGYPYGLDASGQPLSKAGASMPRSVPC